MTLLFLDEVAERLRMSYWTARDLVLSGKLQGIRATRRIQVDERDLETFIAESKLRPDCGPKPHQNDTTRPKRNGARKTQDAEPHAWRQGFRRK